jgi:hydrogenase/urease accessory protein HupE
MKWPVVLVIDVGGQAQSAAATALGFKSYNPDLPIQLTFARDFVFEEPIALTIDNGTERLSRWLVTDQPSPPFAATATAGASTVSKPAGAQDYLSTLRAGFSHILPGGFDHLMFVLTMLLLCRSLAQTAMLVTAFTIGHSLSLAVAGFRLVSVPATIVEPLILLSICVYALLALRDAQGTFAHHYLAVSGVGLLHGLGFAAAFTKLAWTEAPVPHLVSFNLGIEIAQLLFVFAAYPLLARYGPYLRKPLAGVLTVLPLLWLPSLL